MPTTTTPPLSSPWGGSALPSAVPLCAETLGLLGQDTVQALQRVAQMFALKINSKKQQPMLSWG